MNTQIKHLILGAGLAGLSAAYHLEERGCSDWLILEKSARVGGLCKSLKYDDGFTFDQSIHIIYSSDPYASGLIEKILAGNMIEQKRESWVYSNGVYIPYPWQANTYGLPVEVVRECLEGVISATYERNGNQKPANFEEWCFATFGEGLARHFMIPYNSKLWAVDPKKMTDAWIRDRVMTPAVGEVIEGALHRQEKNYGPNAIFRYPERGGIEALPKGFLPYLDQDKIFLNTPVTKVAWVEKTVAVNDGTFQRYDKLISSLPLNILLKGMEPSLPHNLMEAAGRLEHNIVYTLNLAVKRENLSEYHWIYFPEEKYLFYRISFPQNLSPCMVPSGWSSMTVEVSSSKYRGVPEGEKLLQRVIDDLKDARIVTDSDCIDVKSILTLNPAYIVYNHTHRKDVDSLRRFLRANDIYTCGRFGEWEYLNMDHSIMSGKRVVDDIMKLYYENLNVLGAYPLWSHND